MTATISLCMIVRDEEETLGGCLASVQGLADEIIIVDTGSVDGTRRVAEAYNGRVAAYDWQDDFAAARNYAFSLANGTFILWLDADDRIAGEDLKKLLALKRELTAEVSGVVMPYCLAEDAVGRPLVADRRLRLVRRESGCRWSGRVHEYLEFPRKGEIRVWDAMIRHTGRADHSRRNLRILRRWIAEEPGVSGRRLLWYAHICYERGHYGQAAKGYRKLLLEPSGFREDRLIACFRLADCCRRLGDGRGRLESLLGSFHYGPPQADFCCQLGEWFEERADWRTAAYWYTQAIAVSGLDTGLRPVASAALTWLPHARLAAVCLRLGDAGAAYRHNEQALRHLPDDPGLLGNRARLEAALRS
ncbi:glycosyltransferase family 2 protein [Paenibacillus sp. YN15]|uniref:glycosyltransferase family 2 protein n=1 Tax=Paenibacillus sp. YN15 TaxID=1742774 RepID=UPI00215B9AFD|nr:glycosyltransferase family 2 protein [Paenibacillus sp. YN15]